MPVTFDNVASGVTAGTALQFNLTAAANACLLVFTRADVAQSVSAIAYAGAALTRLANQDFVDELWILTAPASGSNILSAQWAGAAANFGMIAVTYTKVKAVVPTGTSQATGSSGTSVGLSLSSTNVDLVVFGCGANQLQGFNLAPGTHRASVTGVANSFLLEVADTIGAAALSVSASISAIASLKIIGVPLIFSAAAVSGVFSRNLMGVGR